MARIVSPQGFVPEGGIRSFENNLISLVDRSRFLFLLNGLNQKLMAENVD